VGLRRSPWSTGPSLFQRARAWPADPDGWVLASRERISRYISSVLTRSALRSSQRSANRLAYCYRLRHDPDPLTLGIGRPASSSIDVSFDTFKKLFSVSSTRTRSSLRPAARPSTMRRRHYLDSPWSHTIRKQRVQIEVGMTNRSTTRARTTSSSAAIFTTMPVSGSTAPATSTSQHNCARDREDCCTCVVARFSSTVSAFVCSRWLAHRV